MSRMPFEVAEIGPAHPTLGLVARELERYTARVTAVPPPGLMAGINAAIAAEEPPRLGLVGWLRGLPPLSPVVLRTAAVAAAVAVAALAAVFAGEIVQQIRNPNVGESPVPVVSPSERPEASPEATPSLAPTPSPSATSEPTPTLLPGELPPPDAGGGTPLPSAQETPDADGDNSGPGGGGGDNSGPGGGGGDNSGPGGGDSGGGSGSSGPGG